MTFWAILQKVGGEDQLNDANILIMNTFKDIDKGAEWGTVADLFPDVKMEDIQTWNISKNTATVFVRSLENHIEVPNANPAEDFNYVHIIYHDTKDNGKHLNFESEKWKPLVQQAMNEGKTTMKGWGNSIIISPESKAFPYKSQSYDLFASMQDALGDTFSDDFSFPEGFFEPLNGNYDGPRNSQLYRIVAVVMAPEE